MTERTRRNALTFTRLFSRRGGIPRKSLLVISVFTATAALVPPAPAIDEDFRGTYRARWRDVSGRAVCDSFRQTARVRYIDRRHRRYNPAGSHRGGF